MAERTYYDVLRVGRSASAEEIKAAYRALAWQPSGAAGQDELKLINEAYATLSSPHRRAAYDEALAAGAPVSPVPPAPVRAAASPAAGDPDENVPKGPIHLRVWGLISDLVWHVSRVRYVFIPFTWIIGGMLIFGLMALAGGYRLAVRPKPLQTTIHDVVQHVPAQKYISVVGSANYDDGFTKTSGSSKVNYSVLYTPGDVMLILGTQGQSSGRFTGLLRAFDSGIAAQLEQRSKDDYWTGVNMLTTHYLDLNYVPGNPGPYLAGLVAVLLALVALVVPGLKRYTVFSPGPQRWEEPVGGMLAPQVRVEAVARFRPAEGKGMALFHAGLPAILSPVAEGFGVTTWVRSNSVERTYELVIPAGSPVRLGIDHAGGRGRAALKVRIPGQTIYLRLDSLRDARLLAQALRG